MVPARRRHPRLHGEPPLTPPFAPPPPPWGLQRFSRRRQNDKVTDSTWAEVIDDWVRHQPWVVLSVLLTLIVSSTMAIINYVITAIEWWNRHCRWQREEYRKLGKLYAGISAVVFESILGSPIFRRSSGEFVEKSYRSRGYWVQSIEDSDGSVILMSVTAFKKDFRPTFVIPSNNMKITLNKTTLADLDSVPNLSSGISDYFLSAATANSRFYDSYYLGNPGNYQTIWVGINDAGTWDRIDAMPGMEAFRGETSSARRRFSLFRSRTRINTFAVSGPGASCRWNFQVGVDRLLTRTLDPPTVK